jgi:hypothetical protein
MASHNQDYPPSDQHSNHIDTFCPLYHGTPGMSASFHVAPDHLSPGFQTSIFGMPRRNPYDPHHPSSYMSITYVVPRWTPPEHHLHVHFTAPPYHQASQTAIPGLGGIPVPCTCCPGSSVFPRPSQMCTRTHRSSHKGVGDVQQLVHEPHDLVIEEGNLGQGNVDHVVADCEPHRVQNATQTGVETSTIKGDIRATAEQVTANFDKPIRNDEETKKPEKKVVVTGMKEGKPSSKGKKATVEEAGVDPW